MDHEGGPAFPHGGLGGGQGTQGQVHIQGKIGSMSLHSSFPRYLCFLMAERIVGLCCFIDLHLDVTCRQLYHFLSERMFQMKLTNIFLQI